MMGSVSFLSDTVGDGSVGQVRLADTFAKQKDGI